LASDLPSNPDDQKRSVASPDPSIPVPPV
jgi:hypothetical protein